MNEAIALLIENVSENESELFFPGENLSNHVHQVHILAQLEPPF